MDARKIKILHAVIDDYITSAEPVGSRTIARKYGLGVSPATIRNEMSDLEESGYLEQPHTSSGRIPSDKGYRFYVDELMDPTELSEHELEDLRENMAARQWALGQMIHRAARILSALSRYTAVVMAPQLSETTVRRVYVTALDDWHMLLVLVTGPGFVHNRIVEAQQPLDPEALLFLSERLNTLLVGKSLGQMTSALLAELKEDLDSSHLYSETMELLLSSLDDEHSDRVYLDGTVHLFEQPEFRDVERAKGLLGILGQQETLSSLFSNHAGRTSIKVTIGSEHVVEEMQSCSVVTAAYSIGGTVTGALGVVGPTRLDYAKVVGIVEGLADSLSDVLTQMSFRA